MQRLLLAFICLLIGGSAGWVVRATVRTPLIGQAHKGSCEDRVAAARQSIGAIRAAIGMASRRRELLDRVTDLEAQLFATRVTAEIQKQEMVEGHAHDWDEDIPDRWRPQAWSHLVQSVLRWLARDTQIRGKLLSTDCEEFPCISYFELSVPEEHMGGFVTRMSNEFHLGEELQGNIGFDPKKPDAPGYMTLWFRADTEVERRAVYRSQNYWKVRKESQESADHPSVR